MGSLLGLHAHARLQIYACSGVAIQVASGAYAPPVSKVHNILVCDISELCMYEDLRVKPDGMFVK